MSASIDLEAMRVAVAAGRVEWQRHALERIVSRSVPRMDVLDALLTGERIEDYPNDYPFPSALFLGRTGACPLHVVAAFDVARNRVAVITAYEPTLDRFEDDFKTRRRS